MDILFFSNDEIKFLRCSQEKEGLHIVAAQTYALPERCLMNGIITNAGIVEEKVKEIGIAHQIKEVTLCLDSNTIMHKVKKVPLVNSKKIKTFVETEFADVASAFETPMFDYAVLVKKNKKDAMGTILGVCYEKSLVKSYIDLLEPLHIKLNSIEIATGAMIKLCDNVFNQSNETFVVAVVDKTNVVFELFVEGIYYFSTRGRILHPYESEEFMNEFMQRISSINQFNKSQKNESNIETIYIAGIDKEIVAQCNETLAVLGLKAVVFEGAKVLLTHNSTVLLEEEEIQKYLYNLGCAVKMRYSL